MYKLSTISLNTLNGVNDSLVNVIKLAITKTSIDFGAFLGSLGTETTIKLLKDKLGLKGDK